MDSAGLIIRSFQERDFGSCIYLYRELYAPYLREFPELKPKI